MSSASSLKEFEKMKSKFLQENWDVMRGQIIAWWDDLTDKDLDLVDGDQDKLISIIQERYGYTRNLARMEYEMRMAGYGPEGLGRRNCHDDIGTSQHPGHDNYAWPEIRNSPGFGKSKAKSSGLVYQDSAFR